MRPLRTSALITALSVARSISSMRVKLRWFTGPSLASRNRTYHWVLPRSYGRKTDSIKARLARKYFLAHEPAASRFDISVLLGTLPVCQLPYNLSSFKRLWCLPRMRARVRKVCANDFAHACHELEFRASEGKTPPCSRRIRDVCQPPRAKVQKRRGSP